MRWYCQASGNGDKWRGIRAYPGPLTPRSPRSPASLGCLTAGRVIAASGACPPPWRRGTPGSRGPRNPRSPRSPASAWRLMVSSINFLWFIVIFAMGSIVYKIGKPLEELLPAVRSQTQHTFRFLRSLMLLIQTMLLLWLMIVKPSWSFKGSIHKV